MKDNINFAVGEPDELILGSLKHEVECVESRCPPYLFIASKLRQADLQLGQTGCRLIRGVERLVCHVHAGLAHYSAYTRFYSGLGLIPVLIAHIHVGPGVDKIFEEAKM